jgi:hypothetical protein
MRLIMLTILASEYGATMALDGGIERLCEVMRTYTSKVQGHRPLGTFFDCGTREAGRNNLFRSLDITHYGYVYGQLRMGT